MKGRKERKENQESFASFAVALWVGGLSRGFPGQDKEGRCFDGPHNAPILQSARLQPALQPYGDLINRGDGAEL